MRRYARAIVAIAILGRGAHAADPATVTLVIKDHRFAPAEISVPAGQRVRIEVCNQDGTAEEFESDALHVEK